MCTRKIPIEVSKSLFVVVVVFCFFFFLRKRNEVVAEIIDAFSIIPLFHVIDSSNSVKPIKAVHSRKSCQEYICLYGFINGVDEVFWPL